MIGDFKFQDVKASDVGILVAGKTRVIKPATRAIEYTVPGKDGVVSYDTGVYNGFEVAVPIVVKDTQTKTVRELARDLGQFLRGTGSLIFLDEPDKEYTATAVGEVPIREIDEFGRAEIVFRCQPFAQGIGYEQHTHIGAELPSDEVLEVGGTHNTSCIINITAKTPLRNLTITYTR